jgi:hypothetical protein
VGNVNEIVVRTESVPSPDSLVIEQKITGIVSCDSR